MSILEQMRPPAKPARADVLAEMIELTTQRVSMADTEELARLGAHEYDEEIVVPEPGSAGETFLREVARGYTRWIAREARFPDGDEDEQEAVTPWLGEASGTEVARAYVDLGLHYSPHSASATGAQVEDFRAVLAEVAVQVIATLTAEYGPNS